MGRHTVKSVKTGVTGIQEGVSASYVISVIMVLLGVALLLFVSVPLLSNGASSVSQANAAEEQVASWPNKTQEQMLEEAKAYNNSLYANGQPVIGGVYTDSSGDDVDFSGSQDEAYTSALDGIQGIMATVEIPKISVKLPVRHGSDEEALNNGAGHLYGTSLPIGGKNSHSVITAHRGVPNKLLFTRLNEIKKGDPFYITVLGHTIAYKVVSVKTVDPDDTSDVRIVPGKDLVTLLTCTPYGVNTERLLVTGERAAMPDVVPDKEDAPKDSKMLVGIPVVVGAVVFVALYVVVPRGGSGDLRGRHLSGRVVKE